MNFAKLEMTATDKVTIIKFIAEKLSNEEWEIIDLTLKEFNFPITNSFNGERKQYIIQQIQNGKEEHLVALADHLNHDILSKTSRIKPTFWEDGYFRIFISHLASDKKNATLLKEKLKKFAISAFVAHSDIKPTKKWQDEIELALNSCDSLVALMIDGFHKSKWTDQEIGFAMGRDLLIIPIRMGLDPYGFIGKYQAISYMDMTTLASDIFDSLAKNKKTRKKMSNAMLYKFEKSISFADAKQNMEFIERLEYWNNQLISRLNTSKENNSQISASYAVPSRIYSLVDKLNSRKK